jgi:predicted nucleic acid-binding protein
MPEPILLDTNVLKDISRGHQQAAQALRRYVDSGRTVYIAQASYNELVQGAPNAQLRAHYREMIRDLGIQVAPPGSMAARVELYSENIRHQPQRGQPGALREYSSRPSSIAAGEVPRPGDAFVAAQARALNAELWTHDRDFRQRAPQFGVRLAPECQLGGMSGQEDPARGRRLLGLPPIHVTSSGTVSRRPPGGGGGGGTGGGGSAPPPAGGAGSSSRGTPTRASGSGFQAGTAEPDMRLPHVGGPSPRGQAIGGGIELLLRVINAGANWANDARNQARITEALQARGAQITNRDPSDGALIVLYYLVFEPVGSQQDSIIQPGPVFSHLELYFGRTESEARQAWQNTPAVRPNMPGRVPNATTLWAPPSVAPAATVLVSPFPRRQLATFVRGRARLQDVEWGGISGFDDMGETRLSGEESNLRFHILEPPRTITFANGRHRHTVQIPIVERDSGEGSLCLMAVDLDPFLGYFFARVTAVPVFPANADTQRAFQRARATKDNLRQLRSYTNISMLRWVRPENIRALST